MFFFAFQRADALVQPLSKAKKLKLKPPQALNGQSMSKSFLAQGGWLPSYPCAQAMQQIIPHLKLYCKAGADLLRIVEDAGREQRPFDAICNA